MDNSDPLAQFPALLTDPRKPSELAGWLERRKLWLEEQGLPLDTPLTPREAIMVQRLGSARPAYTIT